MRNWHIALVIGATLLFIIVFRVVLPFDYIFTNNGVRLNTVDAYYQVRYAEIDTQVNTDYYLNYPGGFGHNNIRWVFPLLIKHTAYLFNISTLASAAILPPILFILALFPIGLISWLLFKSKIITFLSIFIVSICSGGIFHRTMLGAGDYHCWEILLLSTLMLCTFMMVKYHSKIIPFVLSLFCGLVVFSIYYLSWQGALIYLFILAIFIYTCLIKVMPCKYTKLAIGLVVPFVAVGTLLTFSGYLDNYVSSFVHLFSIDLEYTITEGMSLFFTFGKFDLSPAWHSFGITFYIALIGFGMMLYRYIKYNEDRDLLFIVWTVVILAMTVSSRRFDYYLAINFSIISAYTIVVLTKYIIKYRWSVLKIGIALAIVIIIPLARANYVTATSDDTVMSRDWQKCTAFLRDFSDDKAYYYGNFTDYGVLSWCDYGYWIIVAGHQPVYCSPGTPESKERRQAAAFFVSNQADIEWLKSNRLRYVVVDKEMLYDKIYPMLINAKADIEEVRIEDTVVGKLWNNELEGFKLVLDTATVKVFEVEAVKQ